MNHDEIQRLLTPLPMQICGEDPRYLDDFELAKNEVEKLADCNYEAIIDFCQNILLEHARDLRVAGFYLFAATKINGIEGIKKGLDVYQLLLTQYWDNIHPQREAAKISAIKWLNNQRLASFIDNLTGSKNDIEAIQAKLNTINQFLLEKKPNESPQIKVFDAWLKKQNTQITTQVPVANNSQTSTTNSHNLQAINQQITSEQEIDAVTRTIITYIEPQNLLRACAYRRALKWASLQQPIHENYQTRIPAPRVESINAYKSMLQTATPNEIFTRSEAMFMEMGGHFLLDLQFHAYHAASQMQDDGLANYIAAEVNILIQRIPILPELFYAEGEIAFAGSKTKAWLTKINKIQTSNETKNLANSILDVNQIITTTKETCDKKGLDAFLSYLKQKINGNAKENFYYKYAMAKLAIEAKQHTIALGLLQNLAEKITQYQLADWEPDLVQMVWCDYYRILKIQLGKSPENQKAMLSQQMALIHQQICEINVNLALEIV